MQTMQIAPNVASVLQTTTIWVTFQKEGFHNYPDAPDEVAFLKLRHRHMFHFRVEIAVYDDDRDIEFFIFKRWLESLYDGGALELDNKSCEMIAKELAVTINERYPNRHTTITVSEDGENGATVNSMYINAIPQPAQY